MLSARAAVARAARGRLDHGRRQFDGQLRAAGEALGLPLVRTLRHEQSRLDFQRLRQQRRVLESLDHGLLALDARVGDGTDFPAPKTRPPPPVEGLVERDGILRLDQINKRVPDVALVLKVDGQVEEVVFSREFFIEAKLGSKNKNASTRDQGVGARGNCTVMTGRVVANSDAPRGVRSAGHGRANQ